MIGNILGGAMGKVTLPGDFESIATVTVGSGGAADIQFTSLPTTYQHLQIRGIVRLASGAAGTNNLYMRLNSDTGSNYARHNLSGSGSSAVSEAASSTTAAFGGRNAIPRNGAAANLFGVFVIDILDYRNTNKATTIRSLTGVPTGNIALNSGLWTSTNAVTSITLFDETSANFAQYTQAALYGIKG